LAVKTADVATPDAFVVAVLTPPANVPLAPLAGAVNITITPLTKFPPESLTVTTSGVEKAVLMVVLCGVPLVVVIDDGIPTVLLREKLTGDTPPAKTDATTE
jgi:hypothetical protein